MKRVGVWVVVVMVSLVVLPKDAVAEVEIDPSYISGRCIKLTVKYEPNSGPSHTVTATVYRGAREIAHRKLAATATWHTYKVACPKPGIIYHLQVKSPNALADFALMDRHPLIRAKALVAWGRHAKADDLARQIGFCEAAIPSGECTHWWRSRPKRKTGTINERGLGRRGRRTRQGNGDASGQTHRLEQALTRRPNRCLSVIRMDEDRHHHGGD